VRLRISNTSKRWGKIIHQPICVPQREEGRRWSKESFPRKVTSLTGGGGGQIDKQYRGFTRPFSKGEKETDKEIVFRARRKGAAHNFRGDRHENSAFWWGKLPIKGFQRGNSSFPRKEGKVINRNGKKGCDVKVGPPRRPFDRDKGRLLRPKKLFQCKEHKSAFVFVNNRGFRFCIHPKMEGGSWVKKNLTRLRNRGLIIGEGGKGKNSSSLGREVKGG